MCIVISAYEVIAAVPNGDVFFGGGVTNERRVWAGGAHRRALEAARCYAEQHLCSTYVCGGSHNRTLHKFEAQRLSLTEDKGWRIVRIDYKRGQPFVSHYPPKVFSKEEPCPTSTTTA